MPPISDQPISTIMTTQVITIPEDASLYDCRRILTKNDFHHLPVVEGGRLIGIISASDLINAGVIAAFPEDDQVRSSFEAEAMKVVDVLRRDPIVIAPDDTIGLAASMLAQGTIHALPVVSDDKLVGMLTTADLLQLLIGD